MRSPRKSPAPAVHVPPSWRLPERLATPEEVFLDRRQVLAALGFGGIALSLPGGLAAAAPAADAAPAGMLAPALGGKYADRFPARRNRAYDFGGRPPTAEDVAGRTNNFYEFTTDKERVWRLAEGYEVAPWKIEVAGMVKKPRTLDLDDLFTRFPLEERLYRFRCVEAWAMQVPWTGFPLKTLIDYLEPLPSAKYVRFTSFLDRKNLPGQREYDWYNWPYYEGHRLDEATNEVAFVVVGSYGHALPMQHGAPWRLALPWKYGYKGPKSVVRIELTDHRPHTFWNDSQPTEYGFYSNVDPDRPHPRWSQATERDIGTGERRPTLLYNGYGAQVASLYDGKEF
jgi:methionine sulfoxide reductase catalytic subunit